MIYLPYLLLVQISLTLTAQDFNLITINNTYITDDELISTNNSERTPKILTMGNGNRNFLQFDQPKVIDMDNIHLIRNKVPSGKPMLFLMNENYDTDINGDTIRTLIITLKNDHNLFLMKFNSSGKEHINKYLFTSYYQ